MSHSTAVRRRRLPAVLLTALAAVLCLALFAAPATAADEAADEAATAEGFGTGQWDGMLLAAIIGTVMAGVTFSMSRPGDIEKAAEGHH